MFKLSEKMRERQTPYEVVSKRDGKVLYWTTATINAVAFVATVVCVTSICLVSLEMLDVFIQRFRPWLEDLSTLTSAIQNNFRHLNLSKPGLGDRYVLSLAVCLLITAVSIPLHFVLSIFGLFSRSLSPHPFYGKHARKILAQLLLIFFAVFVVFFLDFSGRGDNPSRMQKLFYTEWAILSVAFFLAGLNAIIFSLFFTMAKLIRFGER